MDAAIAEEIIRVVEPMAIEAMMEAEHMREEELRERQRVAELDLQQARYEASLAEWRYAACDPDNRLIAAQLEHSWEATLQRVQACEARFDAMRLPGYLSPNRFEEEQPRKPVKSAASNCPTPGAHPNPPPDPAAVGDRRGART